MGKYNMVLPDMGSKYLGEWLADHLCMAEPYATKVWDFMKQVAAAKCPDGFKMHIKNQAEWEPIAEAVNQGIDSRLEGFTRSTFSDSGKVWLHPEEIHILVRRLSENATKRLNKHYKKYGKRPNYEPPDDEGEMLARDIVNVMCTQEDE